MNRRHFLARLLVAPTVLGGSAQWLAASTPETPAPAATPPAAPAAAPATSSPSPSKPFFAGVQIGPHSLFDEGIEHCLDHLQETVGVNALLVYSHRYQGYNGNYKSNTPADGTPTDSKARRLPMIWVRTHEKFYRNTSLRPAPRGPDTEFANRDIFETLAEPCRKRGIQLIARMQEGFGRAALEAIPGWSAVASVDLTGHPTLAPCWNHPDYRAWWLASVEDLFKSYPMLAGLKIGSERNGPFSNVLINPRDDARQMAVCFCTHCIAAARARSVNPNNAREGMVKLVEFTNSLRKNERPPVDGVGVTFLRLLIRYPEILAWEQLYHDSREGLMREVYGTVKQISPSASVGWHVHHSVSMDPITRAMTDYSRMADYADFIKPVLYHEITGVRLKGVLQGFGQGVLNEVPMPELLPLLYAFLGYDRNREPSFDELARCGFSTDYIYRETKRCVDGVNGRCAVYPGIGLDIGGAPAPGNPDSIYAATTAALSAGAGGIILSREYDEMREPSLRAVGRALREFKAERRS